MSGYYAFGLQMPGRVYVSGSPTREDFTGHELDQETNLHYAGARYYSASLGRWMSVDPLGHYMPGWSPYNYVFDNPVTFVDPTGEIPCEEAFPGEGLTGECLENEDGSAAVATVEARRPSQIDQQALFLSQALDFWFGISDTASSFSTADDNLSAIADMVRNGDVGDGQRFLCALSELSGAVENVAGTVETGSFAAAVVSAPFTGGGGTLLFGKISLAADGVGKIAGFTSTGLEGVQWLRGERSFSSFAVRASGRHVGLFPGVRNLADPATRSYGRLVGRESANPCVVYYE